MMKRARPLDLGGELLDTAGTGGDGAGTFNISTGAALIAAAAGIRVVKHGNRAASGRIGAADIMERLGVKIDPGPDGLLRCLDAAGICFVFAPAYHPVMATLAALRRELGFSPRVEIADGVRLAARWYLAEEELPLAAPAMAVAR